MITDQSGHNNYKKEREKVISCSFYFFFPVPGLGLFSFFLLFLSYVITVQGREGWTVRSQRKGRRKHRSLPCPSSLIPSSLSLYLFFPSSLLLMAPQSLIICPSMIELGEPEVYLYSFPFLSFPFSLFLC
jgi:hypothetical protein